MPGTHIMVVLSDREIDEIADAAVGASADRLAQAAYRPLPAADEGPDAGPVPAAEAEALARLHALAQLRRAVDRLADRAAAGAVRAGAGYPQLGRACNMSRQGARRRWPGLVPSRTPSLAHAADRSR